MLKAYKYRIYPNNEQKVQIEKTFGCCRFVIGNGISLLIFAGIVSNLFNGITGSIYTAVANGTTTAWLSVLVILLMLDNKDRQPSGLSVLSC